MHDAPRGVSGSPMARIHPTALVDPKIDSLDSGQRELARLLVVVAHVRRDLAEHTYGEAALRQVGDLTAPHLRRKEGDLEGSIDDVLAPGAEGVVHVLCTSVHCLDVIYVFSVFIPDQNTQCILCIYRAQDRGLGQSPSGVRGSAPL